LTVREALRRYEQDTQLAEQNRKLQQINWELQREIADRCHAETRLAHDALHDALTGPPNRTFIHVLSGHSPLTKTLNLLFCLSISDRFKL